ncbi:MAG: DUF4920 domain-containing protein [Flavobacteriia bacterium]|nr:DUF4920 domain-containing protein [Flavobacteriia bacterium]
MKRSKFILISIGICCLTLTACAVAKSEYGLVKVSENEAIGIAALVEAMDKSKEPMTCTIKAPLSAVCQNAGCWVQAMKPDGKPLMIRFKNHFTIPPSTPIGTDAFIHGVAYWDTVSVKALRHFAEDAGKSMEEINKITQPEFKLNFEGDGIRLVASPSKP